MAASCGPRDEAQGRQGVVAIPDEVVCGECDIVMKEQALLGDPLDAASIREDAGSRGCMITRLGTGAYVSSGAVGGGRLYVYTDAGPATRTIGRPGQGPGEFGELLRVTVGPDDTLYVVDELNARVQVIAPEGDPVRSFPTPARYRPFARLTTGSFLFHRTPSSPDDPLFHLVDGRGAPLASFGRPTLREYDLESWIVSPADSGAFWTASMWRYELYRSPRPDSIELTVRREADWFPGGVWLTERVYEQDPPGPTLSHVWEDEHGRLWVYSSVPDASWTPNESRMPDPEWLRRNFDMIVEVLDLERGAVLARTRLDDLYAPVCDSPLMYSVVRTPDGDTRAIVVAPELVEPGEP